MWRGGREGEVLYLLCYELNGSGVFCVDVEECQGGGLLDTEDNVIMRVNYHRCLNEEIVVALSAMNSNLYSKITLILLLHIVELKFVVLKSTAKPSWRPFLPTRVFRGLLVSCAIVSPLF